MRLVMSFVVAVGVVAQAQAQTPVEVLRQGDTILGVGDVSIVESMAINDYGEWLVLVDTNNANENADFALVRNGFLTLQEGNLLVGPEGASLDEFATNVTINNAGLTSWALEIVDDAGGLDGVFYNTKPVVLRGDPLNLDGYAANAVWLNFRLGSVRINDLNQVLVAAEINDNTIPGASDQLLALAQLSETGELLHVDPIINELGAAPGFPTLKIDKFDGDHQALALNNEGDVMYQARLENANGNNVRRVLYRNEVPLVSEGDPAPVDDGEVYASFAETALGMNDRRDYAFTAVLSGAANRASCLVKNNDTLIARERSPIEAIPNLLIEGFGTSSPVHVPDTGDVTYYGTWSGPGATSAGIVINEEIVVRQGETRHGDLLIDALTGSASLFEMSPNGRYLIYRATLETDLSSAAVIDLGRVQRVEDCGNNTASLSRARGFALAGSTVTFGMDLGQGLGVTPFLMLSDRLADPAGCGVPLSFGDLVIDFGAGNPFLVLIGTPWGGEPIEIDLDIAPSQLLVNQIVYAQGIFFDVGDQVPAPAFSLTNALEIEIGAP